jgi:hypothetical protein
VGDLNAVVADPFVQPALELLRTAVEEIRRWHGMGMDGEREARSWKVYYHSSPELARIREVLGPKGEDIGMRRTE